MHGDLRGWRKILGKSCEDWYSGSMNMMLAVCECLTLLETHPQTVFLDGAAVRLDMLYGHFIFHTGNRRQLLIACTIPKKTKIMIHSRGKIISLHRSLDQGAFFTSFLNPSISENESLVMTDIAVRICKKQEHDDHSLVRMHMYCRARSVKAA